MSLLAGRSALDFFSTNSSSVYCGKSIFRTRLENDVMGFSLNNVKHSFKVVRLLYLYVCMYAFGIHDHTSKSKRAHKFHLIRFSPKFVLSVDVKQKLKDTYCSKFERYQLTDDF